MGQITHELRDGRYVQIVTPEELRAVLLADGEDFSRPDGFGPHDEWDVGDDEEEEPEPQTYSVRAACGGLWTGPGLTFAEAEVALGRALGRIDRPRIVADEEEE